MSELNPTNFFPSNFKPIKIKVSDNIKINDIQKEIYQHIK